MLEATQAAGVAVPDAARELAHIRGAQEIWLSRIQRRVPSLAVWPELSLPDLHAVGYALDSALRVFFEALGAESLDLPIEYANSAGQSFRTPLCEILLHLLSHGQYHRGKANVALRAVGAQAVGVDYILWQRERVV